VCFCSGEDSVLRILVSTDNHLVCLSSPCCLRAMHFALIAAGLSLQLALSTMHAHSCISTPLPCVHALPAWFCTCHSSAVFSRHWAAFLCHAPSCGRVLLHLNSFPSLLPVAPRHLSACAAALCPFCPPAAAQGVWEKDEVRKDDSFVSFEEVFQIASDNRADFVLLGGDLFHDNKPSRKTIVSGGGA
jgi:hypothetical protein